MQVVSISKIQKKKKKERPVKMEYTGEDEGCGSAKEAEERCCLISTER